MPGGTEGTGGGSPQECQEEKNDSNRAREADGDKPRQRRTETERDNRVLHCGKDSMSVFWAISFGCMAMLDIDEACHNVRAAHDGMQVAKATGPSIGSGKTN